MMDMDDEGAAGSSSNSDGDGDLLPSRSMNVLITSIVFLGVATVFVVMRSVSKFGIRKRADVDDGVIILAWVSNLFSRE
jgi:hypothetical protein